MLLPIQLNEAQDRAAKEWAADDRLWTTQDTVEFNLRTFARVVLSATLRAHTDLRAWVQHKVDCAKVSHRRSDDGGVTFAWPARDCTCGLDVALRSLEEGRQAQTEASAAPQEEEAHAYLSRLLVHYAPRCQPLPDLLGVCTQIDNLLTALPTPPAPQEEQ